LPTKDISHPGNCRSLARRFTQRHNTISGKKLPAPDPKFGGVIKDDALQSKPWWAPRIVPPKEAPQRAAHYHG